MDILANIKIIEEKINNTCLKIGRDPQEIKLLAVTKTQSVEIIDSALESGITCIGENKIQEAEIKLPQIKNKYSEFHYIGHLQSNKIKKLMTLKPDLIHSIDSISTLSKLNEHLKKENRTQKILVQVNTSGEQSKFGLKPESVKEFILQAKNFNNIQIKGLMTIGMFTENLDLVRACFKTLRELFFEIKNYESDNIEMKYLSMGMTNDYVAAIEEGANILRIGSAIFGSRKY